MAIQRLYIDVVMVDGTEHHVEAIGADRHRWSMTAPKHKWPKMADDPDLWSGFLAWSALYRTGKYTQGYDQFTQDAAAWQMQEDAPDVDPSASTTTGG